jgi:hypothetical protein
MSVTTTELQITRTPSSSLRTRIESAPVWRVGVVSGIVAAIGAELFADVSKALGASLEVGPTAAKMEPIPFGGFAVATAMWVAVGTVLAMVLARFVKHPTRPFLVTTLALTAVSMAFPLTTTASGATKAVLCVSHLIVAAIVIPALATRLARNEH